VPTAPRDRPAPPSPVADLLRDTDQRVVQMRVDRSSYWETWRDLAHFIMPNRARFLAMPNQGNRGTPKNRRIVDRTGTIAMGNLASFLMAGITSPARAWFQLGTNTPASSDSDAVRLWCAEVTKRMLTVLAAGNFYNAIGQVYEEIAAFGTGAMICMPDYEDVVRFYPLTAGEFMIGLDERLAVDTLIREYVQTVGQLVKKFGLANCSATVQGLYASNQLTREVPVIHAMMPNRAIKRGALGWQGMPWISVYYEYGQIAQGALRVEGFHVAPFIAPRWSVVSNDAYGKGVGEDMLPDVRSLQKAQLVYAEAMDKIVQPPLMGDASMEQRITSLLPGALNFVPGLGQMPNGGGIRPIYAVPANITVMAERIKAFQDMIKSTAKNDLIQAISQMEGVQPRNELEIQARQQEQMLMLGPMLERFHNEGLSPIIRVVFAYMERAGLIPPKPPEMKGQALEPSYVSIMAQAQKAVGLTAIEQTFKFAAGLVAVDPTAMDTFDSDEALREYGIMTGMPAAIIRSKDQVTAIQTERAKSAQQQQQLANMGQLAQGAQVLSQTDVGGGQNALQAIAGGQ
jgi:hypothetical protein